MLLYLIAGIVIIGTVSALGIWLVRQGKTIAKSEEMAKKLTAGEIISKKKNEYIKDVDQAVQRAKEYDDKIHAEFIRDGGPDAVSIMRLLKSVSDDTETDKPKDAS